MKPTYIGTISSETKQKISDWQILSLLQLPLEQWHVSFFNNTNMRFVPYKYY